MFVAFQTRRRRPKPLLLKLRHLIDEAFALFANAVALGDADAIKENLRGVGGAHAEFVERARDRDAFGLHRQADQRLVAMGGSFGGIGQQAHPVRLRAVGGPHLAAIDHVVAAVGARRGADRRHVRAGAHFADAEAGDVVAGDRGRQKLAAQLVRAKPRERGRRHVGLHADRHRNRPALNVAEFFGHHQREGIVERLAAELRGFVEAEKSQASQLLEHFMGGEPSFPLPEVEMGIDLGRNEALQRASRFVVLGAIDHRSSPRPCLHAWFARE